MGQSEWKWVRVSGSGSKVGVGELGSDWVGGSGSESMKVVSSGFKWLGVC